MFGENSRQPANMLRRIAKAILGIGFVAVLLIGATPASASTLDLPGCRDSTLHRNDDESSGSIELPFEVDFYGHAYESLYLNNNGNVTFDAPLGDYVPFDLTQTNRVIIAPFFADVDTRPLDGGTVTYGETSLNGRPAFCVLWNEVGYFPNQTDRRSSFQLFLVRGTPGTGDFDVVFRYDTIQWELGSASGGVSARVGFSNGESARSVELAGSAVNGAFLDGGPNALSRTSLGSTEPGVSVFHIYGGTAGNDPRNVPSGFDRSTPWWSWPDGDGDGLPDNWERNGVWVGDTHVDLPGLGADPSRRDAFIYVDVVAGERWNSTMESMLRASFHDSPLGITLHIIRGATPQRSQVSAAVSAGDSFFAQVVRLGFTSSGLSGAPGSVPALAKYVCVCPDHVRGSGVGGEANGIKADHLVLTVHESAWLEDIKNETGITFSNNDLVADRLNAISTMHELGHLYGLKHHGGDNFPAWDRSYRSIMSYSYNAFGVPRPPNEAISTGDLLPRIDYSREKSVNLDWRMGGGFGQLSLVYGQHGERGNFYTTVDDIPSGVEEAPIEAGIEEMLADPVTREEIANGAREVEAALRPDPLSPPTSGSQAAPPAGGIKLERVLLRRKATIVSLTCSSQDPCRGQLTLLAASRVKGKSRRVVIGETQFALAAGSSQRVRVKLTSAGIDLIRQVGDKSLPVTIRLTGLAPQTLRLSLKRGRG